MTSARTPSTLPGGHEAFDREIEAALSEVDDALPADEFLDERTAVGPSTFDLALDGPVAADDPAIELRAQLAQAQRERDESLERECNVSAELYELKAIVERNRARAAQGGAELQTIRAQLADVQRERDESLERECNVSAELDELRPSVARETQRGRDAQAALARATAELDACRLERDQSLERECAAAAELEEVGLERDRERQKVAVRTRELAVVSARADELQARLTALLDAVAALNAEARRVRTGEPAEPGPSK